MANDKPTDWEEELERLKKEMKAVRREIAKGSKAIKNSVKQVGEDISKTLNVDFDFGNSLETYLGSVVDSVAHGLDTALGGVFIKNPLYTSKKGRKKHSRVQLVDEEHLDQFYSEAPSILSLLSDNYRLRLLKKLEKGPKHQEELVTGKLQAGTFKHHISKLVEEGWVIHEKARGRYILTVSGNEALKFAEVLFVLSKPDIFQNQADSSIDDDESDFEIIED